MIAQKNLYWLAKWLLPLWPRSLASVALATLSAALYSLDPLLMRNLIDVALPQSRTLSAFALVTGIAACVLLRVSLLLWSMRLDAGIEHDLGHRLRISLLKHMSILSADYHEQTPVGDRLNRLERDVDQIAELGASVTGPSV